MIKRRRPIRQVSKRRAAALKEYYRRRKAFLEAHPYCQVWLAEHGVDESYALSNKGVIMIGSGWCDAKKSTEIHHTKKPKCKYLNDETTWIAVSREMHDKIENNKGWARQKGYLKDI